MSSRPRMLSGLSDAVVGAIRWNTATSESSSVDGKAVVDNAKSLQKSMERYKVVQVVNILSIIKYLHVFLVDTGLIYCWKFY